MAVLGLLISLLGLALILIGVIAAALKVGAERGASMAKAEDTFATVLNALPKMIDSLAKAPKWLAMIVVGVILVWFGHQLRSGGWPFS
jgi:hypothetical protein